MLPAVLYHLLTGQRNGVAATVDEWLDNWTSLDADDARIAYGIGLALWLDPAALPPGIHIQVEWSGDVPTIHFGVVGGTLTAATLPDLVAAARILLAAGDPPSWPSRAPPAPSPKPQPVQMSLF